MFDKNKEKIVKYQLIRLWYDKFSCIYSNNGRSDDTEYNLIQLKNGYRVPIITKYGDDIITGEHYYHGLFTSTNLFTETKYSPYYYEQKMLFRRNYVKKLNYADYNKIFYRTCVDVFPSEIVEYLKNIQEIGRDAYIEAINKYRAELMDFVYGEEKRKKEFVQKELLSDDNVKQLLRKMK